MKDKIKILGNKEDYYLKTAHYNDPALNEV